MNDPTTVFNQKNAPAWNKHRQGRARTKRAELADVDFYADFNAWLATNPSPSSLKPTAAQINEVFSHTTICSDLCATANNGVCDSSCLYGSDCTDCGPTTKPSVFPVTLRAPYVETWEEFLISLGMGGG